MACCKMFVGTYHQRSYYHFASSNFQGSKRWRPVCTQSAGGIADHYIYTCVTMCDKLTTRGNASAQILWLGQHCEAVEALHVGRG